MERFRDVILGGGCAGLSLAVNLVRRGAPGDSIAVIEPRTAFPRDRTWCYWDTDAHPFEGAVAHRWPAWRVRHGGRELLHRSDRYRYCEIPSDRFAGRALDELRAHGVTLRLGVEAKVVEEGARAVRVETDAGVLEGLRVHDGRPVPMPTSGLLQHFLGIHLRTDAPVFEPEVVTLMDFDVPQGPGCDFVYVLPYSRTEALVEATAFSPAPYPESRHGELLERHLETRLGVRSFEVLRRERGVIPMAARRPSPRASRRIYRIGTAAGLVRPSTGYAFLAIQRFSEAFASRLVAEPLPDPPLVRTRLSRTLDAIFLRVLRRRPHLGPGLFHRLFDRVDADALVRFLSDAPTGRDRLAVVAAMPKRPFLAEAWLGRREWRAA